MQFSAIPLILWSLKWLQMHFLNFQFIYMWTLYKMPFYYAILQLYISTLSNLYRNVKHLVCAVNNSFHKASNEELWWCNSISAYIYCKISNMRHTKSQNLNDPHLILQLSSPNPLKPGVKSRRCSWSSAENEDVVGAALTGDTPNPSEWSTS